MLFYIDDDNGTSITGWLIPDNPSDVPEFLVEVPNRPPVQFHANVIRPDIHNLGLHPTGQVGFMIDAQLVPDLNAGMAITIYEAENNLPFYRRHFSERKINRKVFIFDSNILSQVKFLRNISKSFTLGYPMIERHSLETTVAIIANNYVSSILLSGKPNWQRVGETLKDQGFVSFALLRNPFDELAERLLFLSYLRKRSTSNSVSAIFARQMPLMPVVEALESPNEKALLQAFRKLSNEQRRLLRSPMTAAIACTPDEQPSRKNVSIALDCLAQFDLVGVYDHFHAFSTIADGIIGTDLFGENMPETLPGTQELAERLSHIGIVADILDEDIALHTFARSAIETANGLAEDA